MKKVKKVVVMILVVLSVYASIGVMFPELRSRENLIRISHIN